MHLLKRFRPFRRPPGRKTTKEKEEKKEEEDEDEDASPVYSVLAEALKGLLEASPLSGLAGFSCCAETPAK